MPGIRRLTKQVYGRLEEFIVNDSVFVSMQTKLPSVSHGLLMSKTNRIRLQIKVAKTISTKMQHMIPRHPPFRFICKRKNMESIEARISGIPSAMVVIMTKMVRIIKRKTDTKPNTYSDMTQVDDNSTYVLSIMILT